MNFEEGLTAIRSGKKVMVDGEIWEMHETGYGNTIITCNGNNISEINMRHYLHVYCEIVEEPKLYWRRNCYDASKDLWVSELRWYSTQKEFMDHHDGYDDYDEEWESRSFVKSGDKT